MALLLSPSTAPSPAAPRSFHRPPAFCPCAAAPCHRRFGSKPSPIYLRRRARGFAVAASVEEEQAEVRERDVNEEDEEEEEVEIEATPEELEYISQIQRILELLKQNRDMTFGEVKLTIMIEDPRDIERKRLLEIEDPDEVTRDDLADALVDVHEGRVPKNRDALKVLAKELSEWPDLEIEAPKKKGKPGKSLYAKATDTGIDPETAAKRLNMDWDTAADIDDEEEPDEVEVPPVLGYGALYLVTGFPILIGIAVVLILFYNSLQ